VTTTDDLGATRNADGLRHEGFRVLGTAGAAAECERVGHDLPSGLRFDLARLQMVTDCQRCGYVALLVQG
jgi:hypothetical protein